MTVVYDMLKISENKFSYTKFSLFSVFRRNEVISNANRNNSKKKSKCIIRNSKLEVDRHFDIRLTVRGTMK